MSMICCNCRCRCSLAALVISAILGVLAAFLQITGTLVLTTAFLWAALGIGLGYLAALVISTALVRQGENCVCRCQQLNTLLLAILGSIFLGAILLAVGIIATSIINAIAVGLLVFFVTLTLGESACYVRCLADCEN